MNRHEQPARGASETLMRAGLNLIQQALSIYDHDLRLRVCNSRFQSMFGLPDTLVTPGAAFSDTIRYLAASGEYGAIDDVEGFVAARVRQARDFVPHYMERVRANGRTISVEGSPLHEGGWVTVYTDITAIKAQEALLRARSQELHGELLTRAEELSRTNRELAATNAALEQARRDLTESEARTRLTTEMMPAHIAHLGRDWVYTYSNRRLSAVLPGRPTEIVGATARDALGTQVFEAIRPHVERAFMGHNAVHEFTHARSGRRIRVAFSPARDDQGGVTGAYVLSMDVTEEAQARSALAQTHKRELAAQLTSGLAHDFSNLLTIILGLEGQISRLDDLPAAAREKAGTIRAAALRGGAILEKLSEMSGPRALRPAATDIGRLLADVAALASPALPKGLALEWEVDGLEGPVIVDRGSLQDSLLNLVLNARDAMAGKDGTIMLAAGSADRTWLAISVEDEGPGFSEDALDRALEPFFTTKGAGDGTGLGLTMVYDFAQLSGGFVRLANRDGGGASVRLTLPLRQAPRAAEPAMVLVVEDEDAIRLAVREMLQDIGHSVIEATGAEEALMLADVPGIDIVLSDIWLGAGQNGAALADRIAARGAGQRLLLMSSLPDEAPERQRAAARYPILRKPFSREELAAFLSRPDAGP